MRLVSFLLHKRPSRRLIINGETALKGRYPYFVTLDHFCGGALIAPDVVLVAGHCKTSNKNVRKAHYAHVGRYSFKHDIDGVDYEEIRIVQQVRHPSFKWVGDDEFIHDFLLLKLKRPSTKPTIQLNRHAHVPAENQTVVAMGVGNTDPDYESKSDVLKEVSLNAIANKRCEESYDLERNTSYHGRIFPSMMCTTGGEQNERDAWCVCVYVTQQVRQCEFEDFLPHLLLTMVPIYSAYDSGSPIIIPGDSPDTDVLVALVSWGEVRRASRLVLGEQTYV
jgi:secreted trypsin-like serine protease